MDSTVRMLLRWQGAYEGVRVDAAAARLPECVQDMMLLPDTSDWAPESVLPPLQVGDRGGKAEAGAGRGRWTRVCPTACCSWIGCRPLTSIRR